MSSRSFDPEGDHRRKTAHDLFMLGRTFVKNGDLARARQLLQQAVDKDPDHDQAWVWLTATTQDPSEQKQYLEWAVAANPANALARRGLSVLIGKLSPKDMLPEGQTPAPRRPTEPEATTVRRIFECPRCGGRMQFDPEIVDLKCENCGFVEVVEEVLVRDGGQVLDFTLPTRHAHQWAEAERRLACQQCGATTIFPQGQTSATCPFCASRAFVESTEDAQLLLPQGLIPMALTDVQASQAIRGWLGRGFFAPDDLRQLARTARPQPAYVPCWSFSATLTSRWRAMVSEGYGRDQRWVWRDGENTLFYTDQLRPGTRALPPGLLQKVQPFDLTRLVEYKPEYLAGWPAATYDISLADASIQARGEMVADARRKLVAKVFPGRLLKDFEITSSDFTGQTYKLMLLPMWVGAFQYQSRTFRVLINGQTGKVAGDKPTDWSKVVIIAVSALLIVGLIAAALALLLR